MLRCHFQNQTAAGEHGLWRCIPVRGTLYFPYPRSQISFSPQSFNGMRMSPHKMFSNDDDNAIKGQLPRPQSE
jgi:hypothetical protein